MKPNEKLSITFDSSGDQADCFPNGYYIVVVLAHGGNTPGWYNAGCVWHIAALSELDALLAARGAA